jgi:FkbM family methyltransferase
MMKLQLKQMTPRLVLAAWRALKPYLMDVDAVKSYSQEGEDMILRRIFSGRQTGFYVDVGAHHPRRFSNTYYFYKLGWSGINIDATPGSMTLFRRWRPRDINLELAVGSENTELVLFLFNEPALNTFDAALARSRDQGPYRIVREQKIPVQPLAAVLEAYLPTHRPIDFLSVDVEGMDLNVLQSNDWERFRPECVLVECFGANLLDLVHEPANQFLCERGYQAVAKTVNTVIFKSERHV